MKKVTIQAYEDPSREEGGHAVILLHGLARPQGTVKFRIRPVDGVRPADGSGGWIGGEPVETAKTEQGLELVAGPEVTESEHLLAGTVVEIEIPAIGVRGEFLWPNIAPVMRPSRARRKGIVVNRPRAVMRPVPVALPQQQAPQQVTPAREPEAELAIKLAIEPAAPDAIETSHTPDAQVRPADVPAPSVETVAGPEPVTIYEPAVAEADPAEASILEATVDEAAMQSKVPIESGAGGHDPPDAIKEIATKHSWAFRKDVNVMLSKKFFALGDARHDEAQDAAVEATATSGHHSIAAEATAILAHQGEEAEPMPGLRHDIEPEHYQPAHDGAHSEGGSETFYHHARGSVIAPAHAHTHPHPPRERKGVSAGLAAGLATLAIGAITAVALLSGPPSVGAGEAPSKIAVAFTPTSANTAQPDGADPQLFDALVVGGLSPKGVDAAGVGAAKALEKANLQLLSSGSARDTEEGAFWLKQYIASELSDERTLRAMTQLGSLYAEPTGRAPDYGKARLLWEIASAAGDPVAMCFLGLLYESGLGVPANKASALQWYQRSKDKGGCPNIDESLARARQ